MKIIITFKSDNPSEFLINQIAKNIKEISKPDGKYNPYGIIVKDQSGQIEIEVSNER